MQLAICYDGCFLKNRATSFFKTWWLCSSYHNYSSLQSYNSSDARISRYRKNGCRWLCLISQKLWTVFCCNFEVLFILPWCIYSPNFMNTLITIWEICPLQFIPYLKKQKMCMNKTWISHHDYECLECPLVMHSRLKVTNWLSLFRRSTLSFSETN